MNGIKHSDYKVYNTPNAASVAGAVASLRSIPPSGMSTYRVLSGFECNKQHSIGGHAAGVLGFKEKASAKPRIDMRSKLVEG